MYGLEETSQQDKGLSMSSTQGKRSICPRAADLTPARGTVHPSTWPGLRGSSTMDSTCPTPLGGGGQAGAAHPGAFASSAGRRWQEQPSPCVSPNTCRRAHRAAPGGTRAVGAAGKPAPTASLQSPL